MPDYKGMYAKAPYEQLLPTFSDPHKRVYKFNSITHFVSYVEDLVEFPRNARNDMKSSYDGDPNWAGSPSLDAAFDLIRETKFKPDESENIQAMVNKVRKKTKFAGEGYELEVPEYVAGSEKYWIDDTTNHKKSRIIDEPIFISSTFLSHRSSDVAKQVGLAILNGIYKRNVVPRKVVIMFNQAECVVDPKDYGTTGRVDIFVDVSFADIHGIAKALHPATFRRLVFRILENIEHLHSGYGRTDGLETGHGFISIDTVYDWYDREKKTGLDTHIDKLLGIKK